MEKATPTLLREPQLLLEAVGGGIYISTELRSMMQYEERLNSEKMFDPVKYVKCILDVHIEEASCANSINSGLWPARGTPHSAGRGYTNCVV